MFTGPMFKAFQQDHDAANYYDGIMPDVELKLRTMQLSEVLGRTEDDVVLDLLNLYLLGDIIEDPLRPATAPDDFEIHVSEVRDVRNSTVRHIDSEEAKVVIYLVKTINIEKTLRLYTDPIVDSTPLYAEFHIPECAIRFSVTPDNADKVIGAIQAHLSRISVDVRTESPRFIERVRERVVERVRHLESRSSTYRSKLAATGIQLVRKDDAIDPVSLTVKSNVEVLRQSANQQIRQDPVLSDTSLESVLRLINQAGRGFEVAPGVFGQFREETLTSIVLRYLNAVFDCDVATGETFSVSGKTDILLTIAGGAVLIAECHWWEGSSTYVAKVMQLFRYVTFRQSSAVMVTFTDRGDSLAVVRAARMVTHEHASRRGDIIDVSDTSFRSTHQHPREAEKQLDVRHLFFNLQVPADAVRGAQILRALPSSLSEDRATT
jgi:hypothetical protein